MKITILAAPEVRGVLTDAFSSELDTEFTTDDFCRLDCDSSKKGLVESLAIALLTEAAVELFRKIVARFTKKYNVTLRIEDASGWVVEVSYTGDDAKRLKEFLMNSVEAPPDSFADYNEWNCGEGECR